MVAEVKETYVYSRGNPARRTRKQRDDDSCSWLDAGEARRKPTRREMHGGGSDGGGSSDSGSGVRWQEVGIGIPLFNRGSLGEY